MRLYLHVDTDWPATDATPLELVAQASPTTVIVESVTSLDSFGATVQRMDLELRRGRMLRADVGLVFASGADPMRLSHEALAAAVLCVRAKVPVVTVRAREGDLAGRVGGVTRSDDLEHDLGEVRTSLLALHRACPELRPVILEAGRAVAEALRLRSAEDALRWGAVTAAWSAVEKLRIEQPRIAPWLVTPDRLLASWAAHLG